jgi:hypothetical protein
MDLDSIVEVRREHERSLKTRRRGRRPKRTPRTALIWLAAEECLSWNKLSTGWGR